MISDIRAIYRSAWAFMLACPLLFLIPPLIEMAQHIVELRLGMYVNPAGAAAAEANSLRLQFGFAKTLALLLPGYWFVRWIMFEGNTRRAVRPEWPAVGLWGVVFLFSALVTAWSLFGPGLAGMLGLAGQQATSLTVVTGIAWQAVTIYLAVWFIACPLGNARLGPLASFRTMHGSFWYAVALFIAGVLPLMVVHYALAIAAVMWMPPLGDWVLMIADSLVVGYLALTITGSALFAARRAAARKGVDLLPRQGDGAADTGPEIHPA